MTLSEINSGIIEAQNSIRAYTDLYRRTLYTKTDDFFTLHKEWRNNCGGLLEDNYYEWLKTYRDENPTGALIELRNHCNDEGDVINIKVYSNNFYDRPKYLGFPAEFIKEITKYYINN